MVDRSWVTKKKKRIIARDARDLIEKWNLKFII